MSAQRRIGRGVVRSGFFQAISVAFAILTTGAISRAGLSYTLTDRGALPGRPSAAPEAINDSGVITGIDYTNGTTYDLGTLPDFTNGSHAYDIDGAAGFNNAGQIIAYATDASGANRAVPLSPTSIPLPPAAWAALAVLPLVVIIRLGRKPVQWAASARRRGPLFGR